MKLRFFIIWIFCTSFVFSEVYISEIMYDPVGDEYDYEYIEIYGNATNISGWYFEGITFGFPDDVVISDYIVIANTLSEEGVDNDFLDRYNVSCVYDYGGSLLNSGENISLYDANGDVVDSVFYSSSWGGANDGNSLQLIDSGWQAAVPTPGGENIASDGIQYGWNETNNEGTNSQDTSLEVFLDDVLNLNVLYDKLFKVTNHAHVSGTTDEIFVMVLYNVSDEGNLLKQDVFNVTVNSYTTSGTGDYIFNETGNYTVCGAIVNASINDTNPENDFACKVVDVIDTSGITCNISLSIEFEDAEKQIFNDSESIGFYNVLSNESFVYEIRYWVEDLFGNIIKTPYATTNTNKKSYTPHLTEADEVMFIKSEITYLACNDTDLEDNYAEKMIIVKGEKNMGSAIEIIDIDLGTDGKAKFGEFIKARVNVYKGNTSKNSVTFWVEDDCEKISYITYSNIYSGYLWTEYTVPIRLKPNCGKGYDDGYYTLFVSGLDVNASERIEVGGITSTLCSSSSSSSGKKSTTSSAVSDSERIEPYELIEYVDEFSVDERVNQRLMLRNIDTLPHDFTVWSYVYRGSKSYSGERTENQKTYSLKPDEEKTIELTNGLFEISEGDYKYKVKIIKDDQKTEHELTEDIHFRDSELEILINAKKPTINKLYTLSKKHSDKINIYATIAEYEENLTLLLNTPDDIKLFIPDASKAKMEVELQKGKNTFIAELLFGDEVIDTEELIIYSDGEDIRGYESTADYFSSKKETEPDELYPEKTMIDLEEKEDNLMTGGAVTEIYVSSNEKIKKLIPLFILILVGCAGYILWKERKQN
ncbi:MAG: lamin tail domain-containing protein [Nanoarchaeota archaeon]|nr:lamin tail domain-containing protein [Nanoarchaeota archaeon]